MSTPTHHSPKNATSAHAAVSAQQTLSLFILAHHHRKRPMDDDDDIQVYKKPWVGLTHEELCKIIGVGTGDSDWNVTKVYDWLQKIEAALKEKNT
jgi:hypothetical protein